MKKKFAIAYHRLVLEFSNGKSFRRVTEEGYYLRPRRSTALHSSCRFARWGTMVSATLPPQ
ncbi:hypothetical protein [Microcoleus sp. FACHB-SPT15]|uniref:hypothetical protein n=1 Tax=Microcoleus sp. FACHB-SPT15 TaxID=2692830 RepID=UPI0037C93B35